VPAPEEQDQPEGGVDPGAAVVEEPEVVAEAPGVGDAPGELVEHLLHLHDVGGEPVRGAVGGQLLGLRAERGGRDDEVVREGGEAVEVLVGHPLGALGVQRAHAWTAGAEGYELPRARPVLHADPRAEASALREDGHAARGARVRDVPHLGRPGEPRKHELERPRLPARRGEAEVIAVGAELLRVERLHVVDPPGGVAAA